MLLKYLRVLFLAVISFIFVACSTQSKPVEKSPSQDNIQNYTLEYKGESENWSGVLVITVSGNEETDKITIKYKGSDLQLVGKIKDSFILPDGGSMSGSDITLHPDGTYEFQGGGTIAALPSKDGIAKATIEWNGEKENFDMKAK